jgi:DeoR family ulaG and ulaABCDEF operon transcriptional repressor
MLEKQRHQLILDILDEITFASVKQLCVQLGASEATIRRDLIKLASLQHITKIRGGAEALRTKNGPDFKLAGNAFFVAKEKNLEPKRAIAKAAASMCQNGDGIIINGGSSTFMMAEFLRDTRMNILTNSFVLAQELVDNSMNQVVVPGGEIYRKQSIILSSFENDTTQHFKGKMMFMGTPGVSELGVMETDPLLILAEQKLRKRADKLVVLADSSKIGIAGNLIFTPLSGVDVIITDTQADPTHIALFREQGVEVVIVG